MFFLTFHLCLYIKSYIQNNVEKKKLWDDQLTLKKCDAKIIIDIRVFWLLIKEKRNNQKTST